MTSEQRLIRTSMLALRRIARRGAAVALLAAPLLAASCAMDQRFRSPATLTSPYPESQRDVLWAVAPLRNESGVEGVDGVAIASALAAQITQTQGVAAVPVSTVVTRLREMGLSAYQGASDARALAQALHVDAVVVGAITHYDPYDPPKIGLSLQLFARSDAIRTPFKREREIDPTAIMGAASDRTLDFVEPGDPEAPLSTVIVHLDGANHAVQTRVRAYANGRFQERQSPLGWKRYLASMTLFTQFAAHELAARLLAAERIRLAKQAIAASLEDQQR